jgi:hypothetical protein
MSQSPAYEEGTSEELVPYLVQHPKQRFRLIPLLAEDKATRSIDQMIYQGMFPELKDLPEQLFKDAEWHGKEDEF